MNRRVWRVVPALLVGVLLLPRAGESQLCSYSVSSALDFGSTGVQPTPQIDATATISVTCTSLLQINLRICLSLPTGSGGVSIADRRLGLGAHSVQYQLYSNSGRTSVWGEMGGSSPPVTVDFPILIGQQTKHVTVYARLFGGQSGKAAGHYSSELSSIVARQTNYLLFPPSCNSVSGSPETLPTMSVGLGVDTDCSVSANPLDFGTVTSLTGHGATTNLSLTCTLDGAYSIALDGGVVAGDVDARQMRLGLGSDLIEYQLYRDSGHTEIWGDKSGTTLGGTGTGSPQSIPVYGFVPSQGPKVPGTYEDEITVTVTF